MKKSDTLSEPLLRAVRECGLSQTELARRAGVDRRAVGRFVTGERDVNLETAGRIAAALGLRLAGEPRRGKARPAGPETAAAEGGD